MSAGGNPSEINPFIGLALLNRPDTFIVSGDDLDPGQIARAFRTPGIVPALGLFLAIALPIALVYIVGNAVEAWIKEWLRRQAAMRLARIKEKERRSARFREHLRCMAEGLPSPYCQ